MSIHYGNSTPEQRSYVESVIHRSVYCQSSMIEMLLNQLDTPLDGFDYDHIENSYEHKCPECGEAADKEDDVHWCPDCNRILRQDDGKHWNCDCEFDKEDEDRPWHRDEDDVWRCTMCDWASDEEPDTEPVEVYEWYLITDSWIAGKLKEMGQPMLDNDYGTWWGRTCTGQAIVLDPTFWSICQDYLIREMEVANKE